METKINTPSNKNATVPMVINNEINPTKPQVVDNPFQQICNEAELVVQLPIEAIGMNPTYIKSGSYYDDVSHLAESISTAGVCLPVFVCRESNGYILVDGHKRLVASAGVGHESIPAIILPGNVNDYGTLRLVMDMVWHKPCHLRMALGLKTLDIPGQLLAKVLGLSKSNISELRGLIRIPDDIAVEIISRGDLSKRRLIQLSRAGSSDEILAAYEHYKKHGELPKRPIRKYTSSKEVKKVLGLLEKTSRHIENIPYADYFSPNPVQNIMKAFATLGQKLVSEGFLEQFDAAKLADLQKPDQFDASNFTDLTNKLTRFVEATRR